MGTTSSAEDPHGEPAPFPVTWARGDRPPGAPTPRHEPAPPSSPAIRGDALPEMVFEGPSSSSAGTRWAPRPEPAATERGAVHAVVDVSLQSLTVLRGNRPVARYPISTAARGIGNREASYRTPLGRHRVHRKIGADAPVGTVFRSRVNTHTVAPILTEPVDVEEDLILTRILWLDGLEPGLNKGPGIDSRERFIYIHGTNEEGLIGTPASHGCVRMRNRDVVALFDLLPEGAEVEIVRGVD